MKKKETETEAISLKSQTLQPETSPTDKITTKPTIRNFTTGLDLSD